MNNFVTVAEAKKLAIEKEKEARWYHAVANANEFIDKFNNDLIALMTLIEEHNEMNNKMLSKLSKISKSITEVKRETK